MKATQYWTDAQKAHRYIEFCAHSQRRALSIDERNAAVRKYIYVIKEKLNCTAENSRRE